MKYMFHDAIKDWNNMCDSKSTKYGTEGRTMNVIQDLAKRLFRNDNEECRTARTARNP